METDCDTMAVDSVPEVAGDSPVVDELPVADESPAVDELPVTNESLAVEGSSAAGDSLAVEEAPLSGAPSQSSEPPQAGAPSQAPAVPKEPTPQDLLLFELVKSDCKLHLGLSITYGVCVVITVVFLVGIVMMHKGLDAFLYDIGMGAGFASMAAFWWSNYKADVAALKEIGDNPAGLDTCRTYSKETAGVISSSRKTKKELNQLWVAYGILAIVMLGFGVFLIALFVTDDFTSESVLVISGAVLLAGGVILMSLAIKAFCQWLFARKLK